MVKKALIAASNHWTSPSQVGTHSIAKELARRGWEIAFVSEPLSPFHFLKRDKNLIKQRFKIYRSGGVEDLEGAIWAYLPFSFFVPQNRPVFRSRFANEYWQNFTVPNIINKIKSHQFDDVDLLYFDNSTQPFWLNAIKYKKSVFRVADNYAGYQKYSEYSRILERRICENVDLVLYTASNLAEYIREFKIKKSLFFPNGVEFRHFNQRSSGMPELYKSIPQPRIVYIGEMEVRFDFELLKNAARKLPGFSFILIGDDSRAKPYFDGIPNIFTTGQIPYADLPSYLQYADVGIIPFNVRKHGDLIKYVNPLKLHQYFAAGLPVIASRWGELERINSPAQLYDSENEFVQLLEDISVNKLNKQPFTSFAELSDWSLKVETMLNELGLGK